MPIVSVINFFTFLFCSALAVVLYRSYSRHQENIYIKSFLMAVLSFGAMFFLIATPELMIKDGGKNILNK